MDISFFTGVVKIMAIFLFGCVGEIITEKSGHLNLGTPGVMCIGATGAAVGARIFIDAFGGPEAIIETGGPLAMGVILPLLFCLLIAGLSGLLYCFMVDTLQCNQNATGLVITTLGAGLYMFVGGIVCPEADRGAFTATGRNCFGPLLPESFRNANWFTQIFFSYSALV